MLRGKVRYLGLHVGRLIDNAVRCPSIEKPVKMSALKWFTRIPVTLFRAKTGNYTSLREIERPMIFPSTLCYPRNDERWLQAELPTAFGLSLLPNTPDLHRLRVKYVFLYEEGVRVPDDLILFQTSPKHFSLEPALPMELERMLEDVLFCA